jgi:hypothetical protein
MISPARRMAVQRAGTFVPAARRPKDNETMGGIQFVTDKKGRKVQKHGAIWADFWDGLVSESRRKEKGVPYEQYRATRLKRTRPRG